MRPVDDFALVGTEDMRHILAHHFPGVSSRRLNREGLVNTLLENMAGEEAGLVQRFRRRSSATIPTPAEIEFVRSKMDSRYTSRVFQAYRQCSFRLQYEALVALGYRARTSQPAPRHQQTEEVRIEDDQFSEDEERVSTPPRPPVDWPQLVPETSIKERLTEFRNQTNLGVGPTCAVCSRRSYTKDVLFTKSGKPLRRVAASELADGLPLLEITNEHILNRDEERLSFAHPLLAGLALDKDGVHEQNGHPTLDICLPCHSALTRSPPSLPARALANGNLRGWLPPHLQDCTWLEERLCAKYLASAYIVRLYDVTAAGAPESRARVMKGHTCAFPLNTVSTAVKLPWTFNGAGPLLSCIVIGPRAPRQEDLRKVFKVRRQKVMDLLQFLRANFQGYPQFPTDDDAINQLPEDDVPELLMRFVVHQEHGNVPSLFETETTGLEAHPGLSAGDDIEAAGGRTFIEHHGLVDLNGTIVPAHTRLTMGLANAAGSLHPDLIIKHGSEFIRDYGNPGLFPGMFPTLFPWGIGGFEQERDVKLSLDRHAKHLLDIADPAFRRHWSFIFAVANIKHRRLIHLGSRLACKARDFEEVSREIQTLDLPTLRNVAEHLGNGGSMHTLSERESNIRRLLNKCELVSVRVPGSKAAMNLARAEIRSYIGQHGIFQLFLTLNPNPLHAPAFQVFFGDTGVDLNLQMPTSLSAHERSIRVADDPVAASDYFHFHIHAVFQYLFGWNFEDKRSSPEGGLLGQLAAFYLVKEHTMRGQLHGHCLVWLEGGLNPQILRQKLQEDPEYQQRYLRFMDSLIQHHLPDASEDALGGSSPAGRKPRQERPPDPDSDRFADEFTSDHRLLGEEVQRHKCTSTCLKGGRTSCRFLFPHDLCAASHFESASNSVMLQVKDPTINWHNPALLVATRHNHDLKSVQSGKSGAAAASYITSYSTKSDETPLNQVSMIQTVFERMATYAEDTSVTKTLLTKCVMQFGRERQLHAQQAATYVRDLGDTWQSDKTLPMLSASIILALQRLHGRIQEAEDLAASSGTGSTAAAGVTSFLHTGSEDPADGPVLEPADVLLPDVEEDEGFLPLSGAGIAHQVDDYLHRGETLSHVTFYDFIRFCKMVKLPKKFNKNHHPMRSTHPNVKEKCHSYTPDKALGLPRSIFSRFPRPDGTPQHGEAYCAAMLAHFVPFSPSKLLKQPEDTYQAAFSSAKFSDHASRVMENWAALTECEDARDADQLLRRKREAARAANHDDVADRLQVRPEDALDAADADIDMASMLRTTNRQSEETLLYMATLANCGWFRQPGAARAQTQPGAERVHEGAPIFSTARRRQWAQDMTEIEGQVRTSLATPQALTGVLAESLGFPAAQQVPDTTTAEEFVATFQDAPETQVLNHSDRAPHEIIQLLIEERGLTPSQALAFSIAARHFYDEMQGTSHDPLRLFMHGEAGTGKTVVVRLLRQLLERYGKGAQILFMAPTGKAACAIGGTTQHSAFAIDIHRRGLANEDAGQEQREQLSARRIRYLQNTFANVRWLFFDEVSMTSCEVMAEIDQALRIGRQNFDVPFGGMNVLFAGDLCQLPPVKSAALYSNHTRSSRPADAQTMVELGRAAWQQVNAVVNFTEQMRMRDSDMAAVLGRLRLRKCVSQDADLLNHNSLRSAANPSGRDLSGNSDAIVLARTNETVRALNHQRATQFASAAGMDLVVSSAHDKTTAPMTAELRRTLLNYNGTAKSKVGLGRLPLFVGMPVVYRGPNQSVLLGVTNGAFATVVGWQLERDHCGYLIPKGAILKFSRDTSWSLTELPTGCIPILPTPSSFKFASNESGDTVQRVQRQQLPLQPGFAMTVHSAQGITSDGPIIVDLHRGGFEAYVAASRATRKDNLILVRPVTVQRLNSPPLPHALRLELQRLNSIATRTKEVHDHNNWRVGSVTAGTATHNARAVPPGSSTTTSATSADPVGPPMTATQNARSVTSEAPVSPSANVVDPIGLPSTATQGATPVSPGVSSTASATGIDPVGPPRKRIRLDGSDR
ncbi:hypothetical protein CF319_g7135 [Tilletia indica]|nr:hypothetical protein CF319_g7135 [Tilletia indica]